MSDRFGFSHAGAHRSGHFVSLGLGTTTYHNGVPTHNMGGMLYVPGNLNPIHAGYHRAGGHGGGHRGPISGIDTHRGGGYHPGGGFHPGGGSHPGGGYHPGGGPAIPRAPITPQNPQGIPGYYKPVQPVLPPRATLPPAPLPRPLPPERPVPSPLTPAPPRTPVISPIATPNIWYRPTRTRFGRLGPPPPMVPTVSSPSLWQQIKAAWTDLGQQGQTFRVVISPTFDRATAPAVLVLPDVFRVSASRIAQASLANARTYPPATGAAPQPVEVNTGLVIDQGVLQAIPGNIGNPSNVAPVSAAPGQEFVARLHVHPGGTPIDAQDLSFLWDADAPRMTGVVVGGTEIGLVISTRQSDAKKPATPNQPATQAQFQTLMDKVEHGVLQTLPHSTQVQKNDARHRAVSELARAYGFLYYRGPVSGPMRLVTTP